MSPPLVDQFKEMDLDDFEAAEKWQAIVDARTMLYLNGLIGDSDDLALRNRIFRAITKDLAERGSISKVAPAKVAGCICIGPTTYGHQTNCPKSPLHVPKEADRSVKS
jgi:hypothetical protein